MKVYRVVKRDGKWHAISPESEVAIISGDDRETIVQWATEVARKHDGEVHVYEDAAKVQVICTSPAVSNTGSCPKPTQ